MVAEQEGTATAQSAEGANLTFSSLFEGDNLESFVLTVVVVVGGLLVAAVTRSAVRRLLRDRLSYPQLVLLSRALVLLVSLLTASAALQVWGKSVTVLFGAAGILTLAIGFASQTSASNLIAGIFLVAERSFTVGDVIQVNGFTGEVVSIDLLSLKLRKFDNVVVRIPNENLIKTDVETFTRYPIRRCDLRLQFDDQADLDAVDAALRAEVAKEPLVLVEPGPDFVIDSVVNGCPSARFSVWATQENVVKVRTAIAKRVVAALHSVDVQLSGPRRTVRVEGAGDGFLTVDAADSDPGEGDLI